MKITIKQIQQFLAVAELGNFSRASKRLGTAQPALSQAIRDLEDELSVRLFDRTTRRVELTDAGREFQNSTTKVMEELEHAVEGVHMLAERRRGRLRIAAPPLLASVVLPQAIAEFQQSYPVSPCSSPTSAPSRLSRPCAAARPIAGSEPSLPPKTVSSGSPWCATA
ncbi:LysR family transcriptional regulator [Mesorhizobium sp. UC74_2]|uniref:LysR family transcriptional regulator n=1 Tax=Mesorhizobium sp. UC74_2 TaxID=3350171 RepID=UPI00366D5BEB